jgi:hypothetical protein
MQIPPTTGPSKLQPNRSNRSGQNRPSWLSAPDKKVDAPHNAESCSKVTYQSL